MPTRGQTLGWGPLVAVLTGITGAVTHVLASGCTSWPWHLHISSVAVLLPQTTHSVQECLCTSWLQRGQKYIVAPGLLDCRIHCWILWDTVVWTCDHALTEHALPTPVLERNVSSFHENISFSLSLVFNQHTSRKHPFVFCFIETVRVGTCWFRLDGVLVVSGVSLRIPSSAQGRMWHSTMWFYTFIPECTLKKKKF